MPFDIAAEGDQILRESWVDVGPTVLIDHILRRYHAVHPTQFAAAIDLARRVEALHYGHPRCPRGLADHLSIMCDRLMSHQRREEEVLFPMMLAGGHPMIRHPIGRMEDEHRDVDDELVRLATLTTDFTAPGDACPTWRGLYRACREITADLQEHMRLENEVLFPPFLDPA